MSTTYTIFTSCTPLWCLRCQTELPTGSDVILTEHDDGAYCVPCGKGAVKREAKQEERNHEKEVRRQKADASRPPIQVKAKKKARKKSKLAKKPRKRREWLGGLL